MKPVREVSIEFHELRMPIEYRKRQQIENTLDAVKAKCEACGGMFIIEHKQTILGPKQRIRFLIPMTNMKIDQHEMQKTLNEIQLLLNP